MFPFKCYALAFIFRTMIYCEFIFEICMWMSMQICMWISLSQHHFFKKIIIFTIELYWQLIENQIECKVRIYVWILNCVPLIYIFIFMSIYCLNFCILVVNFKIQSLISSTFFFFFKIVLARLGPLHYNTNFKIGLLTLSKKAAEISTALILQKKLENTVILIILSLLVY